MKGVFIMCSNSIYSAPMSNYSKLSNSITLDYDLHPYELKILTIAIHEITKQGTFFKTTISNQINCCKVTFDKYWKRLKDKGYIKQTKSRNSNNRWCYTYEINCNPPKETLLNQDSSHTIDNKGLDNRGYSNTSFSKTKHSCCSKESVPTKENKIVKSIKDFGIALSTSAIYEINKYIEDYGDDYVTAVVEYCFNHNAKYFSYFQKVFNELKAKNLITVESFQADIKARQELMKKNQELKTKRIEQSNKLMEQKLNENSSAPKVAPTSDKKEANAPSVPFKKTKFNCISNHAWDYDELECLEELSTALDLQRISIERYNELIEKVSMLKSCYNRDEIELDEYQFELQNIIKLCY